MYPMVALINKGGGGEKFVFIITNILAIPQELHLKTNVHPQTKGGWGGIFKKIQKFWIGTPHHRGDIWYV